MREALQIVRGAVSTKDLVPVLTHVAIHAGRVRGFDGRVYISAPAEGFGTLSLTVPAQSFIAAIESCEGALQLAVQDALLVVRSGNFVATLPVGPIENFPAEEPVDKRRKCKGALLPVLKMLLPFVGVDASRAWACGIQLDGGMARATNNVVIAEAALPTTFPGTVTLPTFAVEELLRIGLEPTHVAVSDRAVVFTLPRGVWLRTNLVADPWPEGAMGLVAQLHRGATLAPVPATLAAAVTRMAPFCADPKAPVVLLQDGTVRTTGPQLGASVGGFAGLGNCTFRLEPLQAVLQLATGADWGRFPRVPWAGVAARGAIVGLRP